MGGFGSGVVWRHLTVWLVQLMFSSGGYRDWVALKRGVRGVL